MKMNETSPKAFLLAAGCALLAACSATGSSATKAGPGSFVCTQADDLSAGWKAVGGTFEPQADPCGKKTAGVITITGQAASFEKQIPGMAAGQTWYLDADVESDCAEVNLHAGSPAGGGTMTVRKLAGNKYGTGGTLRGTELSVAVLLKKRPGASTCSAKVSNLHIGTKPPAGMEPMPGNPPVGP